jgi:recombination protein RecA
MEINELIKGLKSLKDVAFSLGEEKRVKEWLRSGIIAFDWAVSKGRGFPIGKMVEICGDYSVGKSYLAYKLLARAQKQGYLSVLFDTEVSYNREFGEKCGINNKEIFVISDISVEKGYEIIFDLLEKATVPIIFVWDSLAATPTEKELRDGMDVHDLTKAQVVGRGFRLLAQELDKKNSMLVLLNQMREKIGEYQKTEFAPGGRAIDYHIAVKLELRRAGKVVEDGVVKGLKIKAVVTKNRVDIPFREIFVVLRWDRDDMIPWWEGLLDVLQMERKVIESNGWYRFAYEDKKWRLSDFFEILVAQPERILPALEEVFGGEVYGYLREVLPTFRSDE